MVLGRIVHVIDVAEPSARRPGSPFVAIEACAEAVAALPEFQHRLAVVGTAAGATWAARVGLEPSAVASAPLGSPVLAWRALRAVVGAVGDDAVVQPWSDFAWSACRAAGYRPHPVPAGLLPSVGRLACGDREPLRTRLGVPRDTPLVALLADPGWHADARRFVFMIGLLDVAGLPVAGLVGTATAHVARARRFHHEAAVGWRMPRPMQPATMLLRACDAAVVVPPQPHRELTPTARGWVRWSILRAHVLGVPVVAADGWLDEDVCPQAARPELEAGDGSITEIGKRLAILAGDRRRREELGAALATHAALRSQRTTYAAGLRRHWDSAEPAAAHEIGSAA